MAQKTKTFLYFTKNLFRPDLWDEAAALTFYVIFAIFPALLILVSLIAFLPFQELVDEYYFWWSYYLPQSVRDLMVSIVEDVKQSSRTQVLSFGFIASFWSTSSGVAALARQLNHVHGLKESRSMIKQRVLYFLVAAVLGVTLVLSFFLLVMGQFLTHYITEFLELSEFNEMILGVFRFFLVGLLLFGVLSMLYYVCPDRRHKQFSIVPGSLFATLLLLFGSGLYGYFINNISSYSATYGSIGAMIGLLFWFYLITLGTLLGALFNEAMDH